jgi:adenosine deaminase
MNLLITTLGTTWPIIPELLAFTNPATVPLFKNHPNSKLFQKWRDQYQIEPVEEVWIATTQGELVREGLKSLAQWEAIAPNPPKLKVYFMKGVNELSDLKECLGMRELIFRLALKASETKGIGKTFLSLAGGRKNMSADMQTAAEYFGCNALLHVVDSGQIPSILRAPRPEEMIQSLKKEDAAALFPLIIRGAMEGQSLFKLKSSKISSKNYPIISSESGEQPYSNDLSNKINAVIAQSSHLTQNFTRQLLKGVHGANFRALYTLSPNLIEKLQSTIIGIDPKHRDEDLKLLRQIPKTDHHCHLGGLLNPQQIIQVAKTLLPEISKAEEESKSFAKWLETCRSYAKTSPNDLRRDPFPRAWRYYRDEFAQKRRHLTTASFILFALKSPARLAEFIYGHRQPQAENLKAKSFNEFEAWGDLQGSSLLQTRDSLKTAVRIWLRDCQRNNVHYAELRCSPMNHTLGGLTPEEVVGILRESIMIARPRVKLIFIVSRHRDITQGEQTLKLVEKLFIKEGDNFSTWFGGLDLAGAEDEKAPAEFRELFDPALRSCLNVTIHAGEGTAPKNIWEAVYELNADRIGHGLTLAQDRRLLNRIKQRRISLELCPSSNQQIVGYRTELKRESSLKNRPTYPVKLFLDSGLRITINTDDPGICLTNPTLELLRAAELTPHGISLWEIFQLVRNGFQASFVEPDEKRALLLNAEESILKICDQIRN